MREGKLLSAAMVHSLLYTMCVGSELYIKVAHVFVIYYTQFTGLRYEGWDEARDQGLVRREGGDTNLKIE